MTIGCREWSSSPKTIEKMRALSKKEAEKLKTMRPGRRSVVRAEIEAMEAGTHLLLEREDWAPRTQSPVTMVRKVCEKMKREYRCEMLIDRSGWLIERIS
jgi:hypothetical protein